MQVPFTVFYLKCSLPTYFFQVKSYRYRFSCVTAGVNDHSNAVPLNINELGSCVCLRTAANSVTVKTVDNTLHHGTKLYFESQIVNI